MEAYPVATFVKDASGAPPSIRPTIDMATCIDGGFDRASSTYDVEDMTGCTVPTMGTLDAPSSTCSPMDVAISCASSDDTMATPMPLTLITARR